MAYLVELARVCQCGCGRAAVVEAFNRVNASLGVYARRCGERAVRDMQAQEDASVAAARLAAVEQGREDA